jgi:hypothetical protein
MSNEDRKGTGKTKELTPEEAREKRAYHLALTKQNVLEDQKNLEEAVEEVDSADSTLATLILPGG